MKVNGIELLLLWATPDRGDARRRDRSDGPARTVGFVPNRKPSPAPVNSRQPPNALSIALEASGWSWELCRGCGGPRECDAFPELR
jgi:hypothetical protein